MICIECKQHFFDFNQQASHAFFRLCHLCAELKLRSATEEARPFGNHELSMAELSSWAMSGSRPTIIKRAWRIG